MAIDTSIYRMIRPVEVTSPLELRARQEQLRHAQNQNKLTDLALADREQLARKAGDINKLYQAHTDESGNVKQPEFLTGLARAGYGMEIPGFQKSFAEQAKVRREADKAETESKMQMFGTIGQILGPVKNQVDWDNARTQIADLYGAQSISGMPEAFDPNYSRLKATQALSNKDQAEQYWKQQKFDQDEREFAANESQRKASNAIARGQLGVAQASLGLRRQELADGGKAPAGYRWTAGGTLEAIPGGPADKQATATEGERKSGSLLRRMEGSLGQLKAALRDNPDAAKPELTGSMVSKVSDALGNTLTSEGRQRVEAAQLDILDAALTLGTGAAYTREQLEGYRKSYFPQTGDDKQTIKDKEARLKNILEAARVSAGRAATKTDRTDVLVPSENPNVGLPSTRRNAPVEPDMPADIMAIYKKHGLGAK